MENRTDLFTDSGKPLYFYPNRMGRVVLLAMEEILGHSGVNAVLNLASLPEYINNYPSYNQDLNFPFEHISHLQVGFEGAYGPRAGRGLAMRVGRACLKFGLREFGPELGLTDLAFPHRPRKGLPEATPPPGGSMEPWPVSPSTTDSARCANRYISHLCPGERAGR